MSYLRGLPVHKMMYDIIKIKSWVEGKDDIESLCSHGKILSILFQSFKLAEKSHNFWETEACCFLQFLAVQQKCHKQMVGIYYSIYDKSISVTFLTKLIY